MTEPLANVRSTGRGKVDVGGAGPPAANASPEGTLSQSLLEDGSLGLHVAPDALAAVERWRPRLPSPGAPLRENAALISVAAGRTELELPSTPPDLELRRLRGWIDPAASRALLADGYGHLCAVVDLAARRAAIHLADPGRAEEVAGVEVFAALSIASALLLNRLGRALVHAAAVVAPGGRAVLIAGGSGSGKTTTCVNLVRAGWDWLSDDHVVLGGTAAGELAVEGWPRSFNLDTGAPGLPAGTRRRADPFAIGPGRWRAAAPAGALVFTTIGRSSPTALEPLGPAAALGMLLEQSPWLLADRAAAPAVLALFRQAAHLPTFQLRLGLDTHRDPSALHAALATVVASMGRLEG